MPEKVTAGRDVLGDFAPTFAALNDDVLFGQVWAREEQLSPRIRSIVTVTALMASGCWTARSSITSASPRPTASRPTRWPRC